MASEPKKHNLGLYGEMLGFYITALGYTLKGGQAAPLLADPLAGGIT